MTEEICPECGRPFVTNATENGCFGKSSTACKNRTIARLKSRVALLEDALLAADRVREAIGDRTLGNFGENDAVWAYDKARGRTRK